MFVFYLVRTGEGEPVVCSRCATEKGSSEFDTDAVLEGLRAVKTHVGSDEDPDVLFAGGEPLELDGFDRCVRAAREQGARRIGVLTGAAGLAEPGRAVRFVREGLLHLQVALLGPDQHIHDALAGTAGFDFALSGMRAFKDAETVLGFRTALCGRIPICPHNVEMLPATVKVFAECGAEAVILVLQPGMDVRRSAPWVGAAFETGLVNGVWVTAEGVPGELLGAAAAAAWTPVRIVREIP